MNLLVQKANSPKINRTSIFHYRFLFENSISKLLSTQQMFDETRDSCLMSYSKMILVSRKQCFKQKCDLGMSISL